jgi:uncharacterized protein (TIGR02271 family)
VDETIPLVAERLNVDVKTVETGRVRIGTRVVETEQVVDLPLHRDQVEVETIALNRVVTEASPVRYEGDVTIVPVYEERLVVTKQLVLKEELHIRRRTSVEPAQPQTFKLRHEEVTITRDPSGARD